MTTFVTHKITIPQHTERRGRETIEVPERNALVQFEIDLDTIYQRYGFRAMVNRSGKASALHGLIKAKVVDYSHEKA